MRKLLLEVISCNFIVLLFISLSKVLFRFDLLALLSLAKHKSFKPSQFPPIFLRRAEQNIEKQQYLTV